MQRFFPVRYKTSGKDQIQSRLLVIAALVILTHALILTLAPAVRYNAGNERYQFDHWIGVIVWMIAFSAIHQQTTLKTPNRDPYILPIAALLSGIGLLTIWRLFPHLGLRQAAWIALSAVILILGLKLPVFLDYLRRYKYIWLILGLFLTGLTILLGTNPFGAGPARWLTIFGIHFQPSEPLKIILIVYLAGYFTDHLPIFNRKLVYFLPSFVLTGIALLFLFFQRDLGTASIILLIYLAMLISTRSNPHLIWISFLIFTIAGLFGYFTIDLVQLRINTWINPFGDTLGASYQIIQSMIALGEGKLMGSGPGLGSPRLIPVAVSDFIFPAISEELGYLGAVIIILLIILLIYRSIRLAISTHNSFHRYLVLGILFYFGIQSILIIGGTTGLLPLTGVTLPFVSYGGSSMIVSFFSVLILLTISHQTKPQEHSVKAGQARFVIVPGLMIAFLMIEILFISLFSFWFMPDLVSRPENPRWIIDDRFRERGNILDRNHQIIITNTGDVGQFRRTSHHTPLYTVLGYTSEIYGQTGIELSMFPYLRGSEGYTLTTQLWHELLYNRPPDGLNIRLTIDLELQKSADDLLGDMAGAVVLMNAKSGEILTMASHPYFDAENLIEDWASLTTRDDAPLVNRAAQGQYPPGAALFPFILAQDPQIIKANPDPTSILQSNKNPGCVYSPGEDLSWNALGTNGCQLAQYELARKLGIDSLLQLYESLGFYTKPDLHLQVAETSIPDVTDQEPFFLGEGQFRVSPLQMAIAASALSNDGVLPGPRIVSAYQNPQGNWATLSKQQSSREILASEKTNFVTDQLSMNHSPYWRVIATTQTDENLPVTWFILGTTSHWQGQPITVVVVLEDHAPEMAEMIGLSLMEQTTRIVPNASLSMPTSAVVVSESIP